MIYTPDVLMVHSRITKSYEMIHANMELIDYFLSISIPLKLFDSPERSLILFIGAYFLVSVISIAVSLFFAFSAPP